MTVVKLKNRAFFLLGILISLFVLNACSTEEQEGLLEKGPHQASFDLLQELRANIQKESTSIDFRHEFGYGKYLLSGWAMTPKGYTWASALKSSLVFYRYGIEGDVDIEIFCRAIPSKDNKKQITRVSLNGSQIGSFTAVPDIVERHTLTLPASFLHFGQNILDFEFTYTTKPKEIDPRQKDSRDFAAAFYRIFFRSPGLSTAAPEATQQIDLRKGKHAEKYLLFGWEAPEADYTWTNSLNSTLVFYSYSVQKDLKLKIFCRTLPSAFHGKQVVGVTVNGKDVDSFVVKPNKLRNYTIALPAHALQSGPNFLEFRFAYQTTPAERVAGSKDDRALAVAFQKITFRNNPQRQHLKNSKFRQHAGSPLKMTMRLPAQFELDLQYHTQDKAVSSIRFVRDRARPIEFSLPAGKQTYKKAIELEAGIYQIHVVTDGSANSSTFWNQIRLNLPQAETLDAEGFRVSRFHDDYDVVYVVLDAFDAKHSSVYGYPKNTTPFFEKLSKEALVFENMFANAPYTLASSGTLFTSKYPYEHGLFHMSQVLDSDTPTVAELLSEAGIQTSLITGHPYFTNDGKETKGWGLYRGFSNVFFSKKYQMHLDTLTGALDEIYSMKADARNFIYIHFVPPHTPYVPPEEYRKFVVEPDSGVIEPTSENLRKINTGQIAMNEKQLEYIISSYDSHVLFADSLAERIFQYLEKRGRLNKTVLVVTSDHGEAFMQHGRMLHNTTVFDEMIHVPFIIRFPEEVQAPVGRVSHITSLIDVTPTLMDIYGMSHEANFSGRSLLPVIFDNIPINPFIYSETFLTGVRAIRDLQHKYILSPGGPLLFHLPDDPSEQHNLMRTLPVTAGFYSKLMRPFLHREPFNSAENSLALNELDAKTIKALKDLGYIK
ncbi:MAG: sulfatase-like hydrolase/transferase [bacterium]|nr:sulfatase-like hydrolase/transferase [bacterium]